METNVHNTLTTMKINAKVTFPLQRTSTVRSTCSIISLQSGKKFQTRTSREEKTITVTRIA